MYVGMWALHCSGAGGQAVCVCVCVCVWVLVDRQEGAALLSSRDGYLLELTGWTKGSQAS